MTVAVNGSLSATLEGVFLLSQVQQTLAPLKGCLRPERRSGMAGENDELHLKLDRLLAGQAELANRLSEHEAALDAQSATMEQFRVSLNALSEALARLDEAVSEEQQSATSDIQAVLAQIAAALNTIGADTSEIRVALGRLPSLLERAAADAARMTRGDGADVP